MKIPQFPPKPFPALLPSLDVGPESLTVSGSLPLGLSLSLTCKIKNPKDPK